MGQTLITQVTWETVMGKASDVEQPVSYSTLPVAGVSWHSAARFSERLTNLLRDKKVLTLDQEILLPSEAQWEYACRAGTQTRWHFGDEESKLQEYAWYRANSADHVHAVGLKHPNPWGTYDMYGNLAEWCLDRYTRYEASESVDPSFLNGEGQLKIVRGGSHTSLADECQSASRETILADNPLGEDTGVRVILMG